MLAAAPLSLEALVDAGVAAVSGWAAIQLCAWPSAAGRAFERRLREAAERMTRAWPDRLDHRPGVRWHARHFFSPAALSLHGSRPLKFSTANWGRDNLTRPEDCHESSWC